MVLRLLRDAFAEGERFKSSELEIFPHKDMGHILARYD